MKLFEVVLLSFSLSGLLSRQKKNKQDNKDAHLPRHVAIIMDGNGRWAARRKLPRTAGHYAGMTALRRIVRCASELGIAVLTVYAFSTENWTRPKEEVDFLMKLPQEFLKVDLPELKRNNVRVKLSGNPGGLPSHTREAVETAVAETANNTGMVLNFALNYGGGRNSTGSSKNCRRGCRRQLSNLEVTKNSLTNFCIRQTSGSGLLIRSEYAWQLPVVAAGIC